MTVTLTNIPLRGDCPICHRTPDISDLPEGEARVYTCPTHQAHFTIMWFSREIIESASKKPITFEFEVPLDPGRALIYEPNPNLRIHWPSARELLSKLLY